MTPMTVNPGNNSKPVAYAERRRQKRLVAAARLNGRISKPVVEQVSPAKKTRIPTWLGGSGFFVAALALHLGITGVLLAMETKGELVKRSEKVVFQVVEKEPDLPEPLAPEPMAPQPIASESEPEPEMVEPTRVVEKEPVKREIPGKQVKKRRVRVANADPVNMSAADVPPETVRRAVVGIEMSSTVKGGSGPAYAVGNTRMGATASVQSREKVEKLTRGKQAVEAGPGKGEVAAPTNRIATFIPTVSSNFTRPKRLQSVELPYPPALKSKGIEGNVVVLIVIDEQGTVQKVRILKSSGYREFDEAAMKAAQKELYSPAQRDGQAVEYNLKYTYRFRMKGA